jgi:DNA-binding beta-propeller fold protein YncE
VLLTLSAASSVAQTLLSVPVSDQKVVRRWSLPGDPHGIAVGADGTVYIGLAQPQAVVALDPERGAIKKRVVLDSAEIAATKELVTMRIRGNRLYVANGSDESATILSLPDLRIIREITIEGEPIHDAIPDPNGRYLFLLGHHVHVYDANGSEELRTVGGDDPTAIAANATQLAVLTKNRVTIFDTMSFRETASIDNVNGIAAALFANRSLVLLARDVLYRISNSITREPICLPDGSGPQIATLGPDGLVFLAERRCSSSAVLSAASLYGVNAYAVAYDAKPNVLYATERAGYLTIYRVPRTAIAK